MPNASKVKANPFKWEEIKYIVEQNQLELFARSQEETVRYLDFKHRLKKAGVPILDHIIKHELHWKEDELKQEGDFFSDPSTTTVIYNQFPYYFEPQVKHLCAWSKVYVPADPSSPCGDISPETRAKIDDYVYKTFIEPNGLDKENVCWFKNWESLQSVKSISHIHILINDVDGVINWNNWEIISRIDKRHRCRYLNGNELEEVTSDVMLDFLRVSSYYPAIL